MNIRTSIINYLQDEKYIICFYDNKVYIYKYGTLKSFSDDYIHVAIAPDLEIVIKGLELTIQKITKKELLINGEISSIEKRKTHE